MKTIFSLSVFVILRSTISDFVLQMKLKLSDIEIHHINFHCCAIEISFSFIIGPGYLYLGITDLIYKSSTHGSEKLSTQNIL